ncbi:MAG: bacterial type and secretion system family protein [Rhodospirillales bacterium]|nr:bacterial type and secretion system family protein [Rhodospirillales bacterium]
MMAKTSLLHTVSLLATVTALAGCTLISTKQEEQEIARKADQLKDAQPQPENRDLVVFAGKPYFGSRIIRSSHGDPLPAATASLRLTIRRSSPISLARLAETLSQGANHLPIRVEGCSGGNYQSATNGTSDQALTGLLTHANAAPGLPAPGPINSSGSAPLAPGDDDAFVPDFRDMPLETILDDLAQRFDCDWSYADGTITINRLVTRVFEVRADPSIKQITSEVSGATPSPAQASSAGGNTSGSGGSSFGGGGSDSSSQQTSTKIDLDVWREIDSTMAALVPAPGHFVTQRAAGVVTVVAPPSTMRRAASYFEALNNSLAARIAVEITAIYINTDRNDDFGMSLNALYVDAKTGLTYGLADVVPSFNGTIGSANFAVSKPTSEWNGTTAVIKALATNNKLADVQTGSIITQNGVPSSLKLTTNTDIIRSIQFSTVAQAGAATTAAQATTIPTGFSLQILPRIVGSSGISLLASVENSAISNETQQSVGQGASLDLLTTTERNFSINVIVGSGEQIASLGYDQYTASRTQSGLGWFSNPFDGEQKAGLVRTRLLLILRATILKGPPAQSAAQPWATADLFSKHDFQGE